MASVKASKLGGRLKVCLDNISKHNPRINAIVSKMSDAAVLQDAERAAAKGDANLIIAAKDNFCTKQFTTTCASEALSGYVSPFESTATKNLLDAGCVIIGKTNMDEFAMGTDNIFSSYGPTLNPRFEKPVSPGGSSGGSAAAVAADFCDIALGSDTGGSVRLPAAYCSVIGFKPSYGLISRYGVISYAQSLDTIGILGRDLDRVRQVFEILNKYDTKDPTSLRPEYRRLLRARPPLDKFSTLTIGVMEEAMIDLEPKTRNAWAEALAGLEAQGHKIKTVSVPVLKQAMPTYFVVSPSEASSNLSRYDGVRYGHRATSDVDGPEGSLYGATRSEGFGPEVQRRILMGTFNLSADEFDVHFLKAQKVRRLLMDQFNSHFATINILAEEPYQTGDVDILVHPTARGTAPELADVAKRDPVENYINDVLTAPANLAGIPAISIPWEDSIGIQVWGQYGDDDLVLAAAEQLKNMSPYTA